MDNKYILIFLICLIIVILIGLRYSKESFSVPFKNDIDDVYDMTNKEIVSILPIFKNNGYIAAVIDTKNPTTKNIIFTTELKSKNWKGPIKGCQINNKTIIVDMTYDIDLCLIAVGMEMVANRPVYTLYKKETENLESNWMVMKSNSKTIRSVCYDYNGNMLGISSFDGQIYDYQAGIWTGPVNYDKPMKKVFFDKDRIMLGIGLIDNNIYKKKQLDWRTSKWDTENKNKNKVIDCVFDNDAKLIGVKPDGIMKQVNNIYNSEFDELEKVEDSEELLTNLDIIGLRTGIDYQLYGYMENDSELSENLNRILRFKKRAIDICHTKKIGLTNISPKQLLKQNQNQNLITNIDNEINMLKQKGF